MGAGKTTALRRLRVAHVGVDESIEQATGRSIPELFSEGEDVFRAHERRAIEAALHEPATAIDLGGGAVTTPEVRELLRERATVVWLDTDVETCWQRVQGSDRPLAQSPEDFQRLYEERRPLYAEVADVVARDEHDVALALAGIVVENGALQRLGTLVPGGDVELVSDPNVLGIHGMDPHLALGSRLRNTHQLLAGEEAKPLTALDRLWQDLRLDRHGTLVALGGGCTSDAAGFAAATYLRGIEWAVVAAS